MTERNTTCEFYLDVSSCRAAALDLNLRLGIPGTDSFDAPYATKGCYFYPPSHPDFPSHAFFGTQGTEEEMISTDLPESQIRLLCNTTYILAEAPPEDLPCGYYDRESCRKAAEDLGLALGSPGFSFSGDFAFKGCFYFPRRINDWPDTAHFGTGAETWSQMSAALLLIDVGDFDPIGGQSLTPLIGASPENEGDDVRRLDCETTQEVVGDTCAIYDPFTCLSRALELGLAPGSDNEDFLGDYPTKGCFYFSSWNATSPNTAFFGSEGSLSSITDTLQESSAQRIRCDTDILPPPDDCHFYSASACRAAALEIGLTLGSTAKPFIEDHAEAQGCFYYGPNDETFPNSAFFGTGAKSYDDLVDEPSQVSTSAGPLRLNCNDLPSSNTLLETLGPKPDNCGFYDETSCLEAVLARGLTPGGGDFEFVGDYPTKGCYYYPGYHPEFPNAAFYGKGGNYGQMNSRNFELVNDPARRLDCNTTLELPPAGDTCTAYTAAACRARAELLGIQLGSDLTQNSPKGCYYFSADHPTFPNTAFFGVGGSSYDDLAVEIQSGESIRLNCDTILEGSSNQSSATQMHYLGYMFSLVAMLGWTNLL